MIRYSAVRGQRLMPSDIATAIAYVGAFVGLVGGGVALFNSRMAVAWKRAELANSYLKDLNSSPELTFACRCLDWSGGKLIVPESLRPFLADGEKSIQHDKLIFAHALRPDLQIGELERFSVDVNRNSKGVPKGAQIRFGLL